MSTHFLLVDGLLRPDALAHLYRHSEALAIDALYLGSRWAPFKDQGPILLQASAGLVSEWHDDPTWRACAGLLSSPAPLQEVATHLRYFLCPPDHLGNASLLRFADPLVAYFWLASHTQARLNQVLGPIEQFQVASPRQPWQPEPSPAVVSFVREGPVHDWLPGFELQGPAQLEAFEQAYDFLFKQRLHAHLDREQPIGFADLSPQQLDIWLTQTLNSGREWGLISEFALATWAWYRHTLGTEFTTMPSGAYQTWLRLQPEQAALMPEQRLAAFDLHHEQGMTKECRP